MSRTASRIAGCALAAALLAGSTSAALAQKTLTMATGDAVGKVASIDLDADTGRLHTLWVKTRGISGLLEDELAVSWNAIVSASPGVPCHDGLRTTVMPTLCSQVPSIM